VYLFSLCVVSLLSSRFTVSAFVWFSSLPKCLVFHSLISLSTVFICRSSWILWLCLCTKVSSEWIGESWPYYCSSLTSLIFIRNSPSTGRDACNLLLRQIIWMLLWLGFTLHENMFCCAFQKHRNFRGALPKWRQLVLFIGFTFHTFRFIRMYTQLSVATVKKSTNSVYACFLVGVLPVAVQLHE
jgi:hypothetical protein